MKEWRYEESKSNNYMNISNALLFGKNFLKRNGIESYFLDAELLLMHVLGEEKTFLYAHGDNVLGEEVKKLYFQLLKKRAKRFPVAYLIGKKEFYGNLFFVDEGVFCPRPETELLIDTAKEIFSLSDRIKVYEIGCGTGIISITLAKIFKKSYVYCCDISEKAISNTLKNAKFLKVESRLKVFKGSFFEPVNDEKFDLIISNPPYLSKKDYISAEPEVRKEPKKSLMAKEGGLMAIKKIIRGSKKHLKKNGYLILEIGSYQGNLVIDYAKRNGFVCEIRKDLAELDRVFVGRL